MKVLTGKNALMSIWLDDTWYPVLCAYEVAFRFWHEEVLTTTRTSGKYRRRISRLMDWNFTISGLTKIDDSDGQKGFFYLSQASVRGTAVQMRIRYTDDDGNMQDVHGNVLVMEGMISSLVGGFSNASFTLPGDGEPVIGTSSGGTPQNLYHKYLETTEGAFEVSHADLGGITSIYLVEREDGGYVVVTGTPVGRQVKYTDLGTSGKLTFDSSLPFNAGEIVHIIYAK